MALCMNWFSHSSLKWPLFEAQSQRAVWDAEFNAPVSQTKSFTVPRNHVITSHVSLLLRRCSPANIPRLVIPIFVRMAVNRMLRAWAYAHILQKTLKALFSLPLWTHRYSPSPIHVVFWVIRAIAAIEHIRPITVFRRSAFPVGYVRLSNSIQSQTSAGLTRSVFNRNTCRRCNFSTDALAFQSRCERRSNPFDNFQYSQSSKSLSDHLIVNCRAIRVVLISQVVHLRNRLNYAVRLVGLFMQSFEPSYCSI